MCHKFWLTKLTKKSFRVAIRCRIGESKLSQFVLAVKLNFQLEYRDKFGMFCQLVENKSYYVFLQAMVTRPGSKEQLQKN